MRVDANGWGERVVAQKVVCISANRAILSVKELNGLLSMICFVLLRGGKIDVGSKKLLNPKIFNRKCSGANCVFGETDVSTNIDQDGQLGWRTVCCQDHT